MTPSPTKPDDDQERRERAIGYIMKRDHVTREVASKAMQRLNGPQLWMLERELKPRGPMFVSDYDPFGRT
jgi:hypothetical protein